MPHPTRSPRPEIRDPVVKEFLLQLEQDRGVSPNTLRNYRQALLEFKAGQPGKSWWTLTPADFKTYLYRLARGQKLGPGSVRLRFAALRTFYKQALREGKIRSNPVADLALPKMPRRLPIFLSQEQVLALLDAPRQLALAGKEAARRRRQEKGGAAHPPVADAARHGVARAFLQRGPAPFRARHAAP